MHCCSTHQGILKMEKVSGYLIPPNGLKSLAEQGKIRINSPLQLHEHSRPLLWAAEPTDTQPGFSRLQGSWRSSQGEPLHFPAAQGSEWRWLSGQATGFLPPQIRRKLGLIKSFNHPPLWGLMPCPVSQSVCGGLVSPPEGTDFSSPSGASPNPNTQADSSSSASAERWKQIVWTLKGTLMWINKEK